MVGLILNLEFYTEETDGLGDTVKIFLFPDLSLSASSGSVLVARWWYTVLDRSTTTMYADTYTLLQRHKVAPIKGWEKEKSMLKKWEVFLAFMWVPTQKHPSVYEIMLLIDAEEEVNERLQAQS